MELEIEEYQQTHPGVKGFYANGGAHQFVEYLEQDVFGTAHHVEYLDAVALHHFFRQSKLGFADWILLHWPFLAHKPLNQMSDSLTKTSLWS